jgi:hypothetical protein
MNGFWLTTLFRQHKLTLTSLIEQPLRRPIRERTGHRAQFCERRPLELVLHKGEEWRTRVEGIGQSGERGWYPWPDIGVMLHGRRPVKRKTWESHRRQIMNSRSRIHRHAGWIASAAILVLVVTHSVSAHYTYRNNILDAVYSPPGRSDEADPPTHGIGWTRDWEYDQRVGQQ